MSVRLLEGCISRICRSILVFDVFSFWGFGGTSYFVLREYPGAYASGLLFCLAGSGKLSLGGFGGRYFVPYTLVGHSDRLCNKGFIGCFRTWDC
jgi:hypothetical protein